MTTPSKPSDNLGKMMTRRIKDRDKSTVILTYSALDANAMRKLVQSIRIKGDRSPSLSLIARRSLRVYLERLERCRTHAPDLFAAEVADLERMVTPIPQPAPRTRKPVASTP